MGARALSSYAPNGRVGIYAISAGLVGAALGGFSGYMLQGTYCPFGAKGVWAPGVLCPSAGASKSNWASEIGGVIYLGALLGGLGLGYLGSRFDGP